MGIKKMRFGLGILAILAVGAPAAHAVPPSTMYEYRVYIDTDQNSATGCNQTLSDANGPVLVQGIDQQVIVAVTRTGPTSATVTGISRRECTAGSYGAPILVNPGSWPVGLDNGYAGADVVEAAISRAALGNPTAVRMVFYATISGASDVLATSNGFPTGGPILFDLTQRSPAPALSGWGLGAAVLLLLGAGLRHPAKAADRSACCSPSRYSCWRPRSPRRRSSPSFSTGRWATGGPHRRSPWIGPGTAPSATRARTSPPSLPQWMRPTCISASTS